MESLLQAQASADGAQWQSLLYDNAYNLPTYAQNVIDTCDSTTLEGKIPKNICWCLQTFTWRY